MRAAGEREGAHSGAALRVYASGAVLHNRALLRFETHPPGRRQEQVGRRLSSLDHRGTVDARTRQVQEAGERN